MSFRTHITIADRGWILEKLAKEIAVRSNAVSYGTDPDPSADLHYYINYSCRRRRAGPVEIAFFTHSERDETARKRYFDIARDVEHSVCMSRKYADELAAAGIKDVTTITPGVDLDAFTPKVRIGVIGRTYHTGRKGEALVAEVMDVPGIEWRFTGQGWPGPSTFVADGKMPDFYNDLDYVLVPALYEGGPMCVLEGLACGKPIIASDVGWVDEYPHIPFENGNADSLRQVLTRLVDERLKLRDTVAHRTWSAWGDAHLELFDKIARQHGIVQTSARTAKAPKANGAAAAAAHKVSALLLTHGGEGKTLGGPSVRVPRTAEELARIGVAASLAQDSPAAKIEADVVHVFNCWPLDSAFGALSSARRSGKATVFSPIFLNLTHRDIYDQSIPRLISHNQKSAGAVRTGLAALKAEVVAADSVPPVEPFPGYADKLAACLNEADHIVFLSEYEKRCVEQLVGIPKPHSIVRNPVDPERFDNADPDLFRKEYGLDRYILCVGRIEARKNQVMLAYAARSLDVPVVFIGHDGNAGYGRLLRAIAPGNTVFVPRIEPKDPLLASAFAGASAFCLPSWAEGAPLAALEACAAGAPLVLSDRSSEPEYFGDLAHYVNPADLDGLILALQAAISEAGDEGLRTRRRELARSQFTWARHVTETADVYRTALEAHAAADATAALPLAGESKIYIDLTTSWHHSGHPTGIARVEEKALGSLLSVYGTRIVPIVWNSNSHNYLKLSISDAVAFGDMAKLTQLEASGRAQVIETSGNIEPGRILVFGGAWIRNGNFIAALRRLKLVAGLNVTLLVHDIIQHVARHMYPGDVADVFSQNLVEMVDCADSFLAYSDVTIRDLSAYLAEQGEHLKPIHKFRLGDIRSDESEEGEDLLDRSELCKSLENEDFVIYVSSLDLRKNHILLVNVWRRLLQQRGNRTPLLLMVGRNMWRGEQIMEMVEAEPKLAQKVKFLQNVNDEELHWLYRKCKFTLYPSLYEGWGLPVAESLAVGKVCIASNSTSTAEIAPELTELLDPYDFRSWVEKVGYFLDNPAALEARENEIRTSFSFVDWDDSVTQIVTKVDTLPMRPQSPPVVWAESALSFAESTANRNLVDAISGDSWGRLERNGRWMIGKTSKLNFSTFISGDGPLFLRLQGFAFTAPGLPARQIQVRIGDVFQETYMVLSRPGYIDLQIDPGALPSTNPGFADIQLELETFEQISPASVSNSSDKRTLGFHLMDMAVSRSRAALDRLLPCEQQPATLTKAEYTTQAALIPAATSQSGLSDAQKRALREALNILETPKSLAPTNPLFRMLRVLKADVFLLKVYGKLTGRTHDALRRTISVIVNDGE